MMVCSMGGECCIKERLFRWDGGKRGDSMEMLIKLGWGVAAR